MQDYSDDGFEDDEPTSPKKKVVASAGAARVSALEAEGPSSADVDEMRRAMAEENAAAKARRQAEPASSQAKDSKDADDDRPRAEAEPKSEEPELPKRAAKGAKRPAPAKKPPVKKYVNFGADLNLAQVKANDPRMLRIKVRMGRKDGGV